MTEHSDHFELVPSKDLQAQETAQLERLIRTAKEFPRSLKEVKARMLDLATLDQETAESCFYSLRRDGKVIRGPSVRMAEIAFHSWGNVIGGARTIGDDGKFLTCQGAIIDLERNTRVTIEAKRRIVSKDGRRYSDDMVAMTANAGNAVAFRNSVFKCIPFALVKPVYQAAMQVAVGDQRTLEERRERAIEYFVKAGVAIERVYAALGVSGKDDVGLDHLVTLTGFRTALNDNETTLDELFPAQIKTQASKLTAEEEPQPEAKPAAPKRRRRTKAEIEAAKSKEAQPPAVQPAEKEPAKSNDDDDADEFLV